MDWSRVGTLAEVEEAREHARRVGLYEIGGRTYTIDIPSRGSPIRDTCPLRLETLTTGHMDRDVTVTEVTDPAVKHQAVIAYAEIASV